MKRIIQSGFTLIELLVVIAIIGILAAVVLASLGDARDGASDSSLQQTLGNTVSQAEIYFNGNSFSYEDMCDDTTIENLLISAYETVPGANAIATGAQGNTEVFCNSTENSFVISAPLTNSDDEGGRFWCVDSDGNRTETSESRADGATDCN